MPEILNIGSESDNPLVVHLTNFSADELSFDSFHSKRVPSNFASVEGFIQGLKFPEDDPRREEAFRSVGIAAKRLGRKAKDHKFVWWRGRTIPFGSAEHHALIFMAIRAKFMQNKEAMNALVRTAEMELTHDLGHPENPNTSLPARLFCEMLVKIREEELSRRCWR